MWQYEYYSLGPFVRHSSLLFHLPVCTTTAAATAAADA